MGLSSFTYGRPAPSLALGLGSDTWTALFRSSGVQTTIYSQNAWTAAAVKRIQTENMGFFEASIDAGFGASYISRTYRQSLTAEVESESDTVLGPHLSLKITMGPCYLGFDSLLGVTTNVIQHIALNFQDVSYITFGFSL